jgi:2-phospho-L-lactate guanylyltransferase
MGIWAVLPVKPFRRGKSRLAGVLNDEDRIALNHCLLEHTLEILTQVERIEQTLVISRDPQVLAVARSFKARTLLENSSSNLNLSLEIATRMVSRRTQRGLLIIPADLPLLQLDDIQRLVAFAENPPVVAIAPDRHGMGTNGMLVAPPGLIQYTFGPNSFQYHSAAAQQAGARLEIVHSFSLGLDLDLPADLELLRSSELPMPELACINPGTPSQFSIT